MTGRRIPALTTGADVWGFFASSLYRSPVLPIVGRELRQNGTDACRRAGRSVDVTLTLTTDPDCRHGTLVCRDTGCGMSEDDILDRFLSLGASDKGEDDTGGFGVGKGIILGSCTWWGLRTGDLGVSRDHVRDGLPIDADLSPIQGTQVTLRFDELPDHDPRASKLTLSRWSFADLVKWLAHDAYPCRVELSCGRDAPQVWDLPGVEVSDASLVADGAIGRSRWQLHQVLPVSADTVVWPDGKTIEIGSSGCLFVRLCGLVQFSTYKGHHADTWILDVETDAGAKDADYPFSLSREKMSEALSLDVMAVLGPHFDNPVTSHRRQFRAKHVDDTRLYRGRWLGPASALPTSRVEPGPRGQVHQRVSVFAQAERVVGKNGTTPLDLMIMVTGVDKSKRDIMQPHNLRLLSAWAQILEIVMEAGDAWERYGIGFALDTDALAERVVREGDQIFYMVNPHLAQLATSRPVEALLRLAFLAAHEVAHARDGGHGEHHAVHMSDLFVKAATVLARRLRPLAAELRGQRRSPMLASVEAAAEQLSFFD